MIKTDIGETGALGGASSTLIVAGAGADVWGTSDQFTFYHQTLSGDGAIVARVASVQALNAWTKAGLMVRETLDAGSKHAFMLASPSKGLAFQRRLHTNDVTVNTSKTGAAPKWLRIERNADILTASVSDDGVMWFVFDWAKIEMAATIHVGVAVSSHVKGKLATAIFERVTVVEAAVPAPIPPQPADPTEFKVLHWNLHHGNDPNGKWAFDRQCAIIAATKADIITLNEVERFNTSYGNIDQARVLGEYLSAATGVTWYSYMMPGKKGEDKGIGNAILSRFSLSAQSVCYLSTERNAVHTLAVVHGTLYLHVWSLHLDAESASARVNEVKAFFACAAAEGQPSEIVAGDFNAQSTSVEVKAMGVDYADAWPAAKALGTAKNYPGNCDGCTKNTRIDYVFTARSSGLVLKAAEVLDTRDAAGVMASDHKPLLVTYGLKT